MSKNNIPINSLVLFFTLFLLFSFNPIISSSFQEYLSEDIPTSNTTKVLDLNTSIDLVHLGGAFSIKETDTDFYLSTNFSNFTSHSVGTFRLIFQTEDIFLENATDILCKFYDLEISDEDLMEELNILDNSGSECFGYFKEGNEKMIFEGIYLHKDKNNKRLGIVLRNDGQINAKVNVYVRIGNKELGIEDGIVKENEEYTRVPYKFKMLDFIGLSSNQIIFYSSTRNIHIYHLIEKSNNEGEKKAMLEEIYYGSIIPLNIEDKFINRKIFDLEEELILITEKYSVEESEEDLQFEIKLYADNLKIDYYVSSNPIGRPLNTPLSLQLSQPKEKKCILLNYNQKEKGKNLYYEIIYGNVSSISVEVNPNGQRWEDTLDNAKKLNLNKLIYSLEPDQEKHIDIICVENSDFYPSLINFYYNDPINVGRSLSPGEIFISVINKTSSLMPITITNHTKSDYVDITFKLYSKSKDKDIKIIYGNEEKLIEGGNTIFNIRERSSDLNDIKITNNNQNSDVRLILTVGKQVIENKKSSENKDFYYDKEKSLYFYKLPKSSEEINYSKITLTVKGIQKNHTANYCFINSQGNIIEPNKEGCYQVDSEKENKIEIINPYSLYSESFINNPYNKNNEEDLIDFYLIIKSLNTLDEEEIKINFIPN